VFVSVLSLSGQNNAAGFSNVISTILESSGFHTSNSRYGTDIELDVKITDAGSPDENIEEGQSVFKSCAVVEIKANWVSDGVQFVDHTPIKECRSAHGINDETNRIARAAFNSAVTAIADDISGLLASKTK